ncbi:hypothetical protein SAMN05518682_2572 [Cellulosimicrobium aquatile]|uniref:UDP-glucose 4-epimerase n=1 Tax=Cellulosimicrobium aquatile TaxID=1612203 RepID=A0A1N6SXC6_9MICO|nr:DUF779 domain-containing protein [Cellulosimicrobium aquatile]SIQ45815.1 hypothetical protein SAMN05518682_2572 [Cellulosimicrobium aquatile]
MVDDVPSVRPVGAPPARVALTDDAAALLARLRTVHGELMFHQSGGCCDGSSPMCYPQGDFLLGDADVHLGDLVVDAPGPGAPRPGAGGPAADGPAAADGAAGRFVVPVWMSRAQFEYWKHTHLTIDVVQGRGAGFSVEAPEGVRFIIRSRLLTDDEWAALDALAGP